ncbi:DNA polymerase III delta prime subunit [Bacillus altitudinis]
MSKLNEIQNKIHELNGGEFQKMMDVYFSKIINGEVYSIGSVIGNNNTKTGTPDTLIKTVENKYIFIEYTVQKSNLYKKFEDDLEKCLDKSKTNIPINEIEKIICCCTGRLSTEEISKLTTKVSSYNIRLELLTIDSISFKIFDFPSIASDFLNITLDTEQILDIDDFVKAYNRGKLATTLNTALYARESEIDLIIESINRSQITILSGKPGVGKTRLALECLRRYKENNLEYEIKCLRNNGQNLYSDLKLHFSNPGKYLLFIDDVNQLTQLNLILDYLGLEEEGIDFRLIVSVREYAERKILEKISKLNNHLIKIDILQDKDIETLCKEEYDIKNHLYIERICKISKGNARLAIMACETAIRENTLESIANVTELVEEYYKGIKKDFESELENSGLLRTAAIYSFLTVVNLKDDENLILMAQLANLEKNDFLRMTEKLHSMEILDIYEGEVAKVSDQILSTYIFYLAIFDKNLLKYSELIGIYFPKLKNRIIENLNGVFSYYYQKENYELIKEEIIKVYHDLKEKSDDKLEDFLYTFWFALEVETLVYIQEDIDQLSKEEDNQINYDISKQNSNTSETLSTLSNFSQTEYYNESLELIMNYL